MRNRIHNISISISIISTYRAELMGCAILGVLWGHLMNETWQPAVLAQLARLIHTAGFIFLSGFGLYYAFKKNDDINYFYKKRLSRILVPYVLLTYWFFITAFICGIDVPIKFIMNLTATSFWLYGEANSWAMWYVSATLMLYVLFPFIYYILFLCKKPIFGLSAITVFYIIALLTVAQLCPNYWMSTRIFLARFIMFPLGIFAGYLACQAKKVSLIQIIIYIIGCTLLAIIAKLWIDDEIYAVIRTLIGLPLMTIGLYWLKKCKWTDIYIFKPLRFLGTYSLEIYLIHVTIFYFCRNIICINSAVSMIIGIMVALISCKPIHYGIQRLASHNISTTE